MGHALTLITALDGELVALAKNGSVQAFTYLYERHHAAVARALTVHTRDPEVAADLAHDTFLAAFRSLHRLTEEESFRKWLFGIARNKRLEYLRRQRMRQFVSLDRFTGGQAMYDARRYHSQMEHLHERDALGRVLAGLPSRMHEVLLLYGAGLGTDEIAASLGITLGATRKRLERAKKLLYEGYHDADDREAGKG